MRAALFIGLLGAFTANAGEPPAPPTTATGLALIQARYAGTWKVDETDFDTGVSRAGTKQYEITRDCALTGAMLDCKLMAEGALQGEQRFTWDAAAKVFHVDMDIGGRPQPPLTLTVRDNSWNFLQQVTDRNGNLLHLRIARQYHSDTEVSYSVGYSQDGTNWTVMSQGTEIKSAGK
ncbi:MAG: hypothetical protein ACM3ZT_02600 [Bacillota bacterium]